MKKLLFTLFVLSTFTASFGQVLLSTQPLELKKSSDYHQILSAVNLQNQVYTFASDKEKIKLFKYNSALFFTDSLNITRPEKSYVSMTGYSFDEIGNPYLYWASEDFMKIQSIYFDIQKRTNASNFYTFQFKNESLLNTFSENNSFYLLSSFDKEPMLKLYIFKDGKKEEKILDFSSYKLQNETGKTRTFNQLLNENPMEMIDTKSLNPLFYGVNKSKIYVFQNSIIITFDSLSQTQVFEIDLNNYSITEKIIPQQILTAVGKSNSFFHNDILYQLKLNEQELAIAATNFKSLEKIKSYSVNQNTQIDFKNSPLYIQTGTDKAREIKDTKKFLKRLNRCSVGLSIYDTPNGNLITVGGVRDASSTGNIILGVTAGIAMVSVGTYTDTGNLFEGTDMQSIYFEGLFDKNFEHKKIQQGKLAVDYISQFINENRISFQNVFPYKDYFILGYYDAKSKQYIMRKFEDDFVE